MAAAAGRVKLREAIDPLVLAVDIGSTASRGDVYDAAGRPVRGGREKVPHQFTTRDDGTSEIDPDQIVGEVQQIITALATDRRAGRIGGVALDTSASSMGYGWSLQTSTLQRLGSQVYFHPPGQSWPSQVRSPGRVGGGASTCRWRR